MDIENKETDVITENVEIKTIEIDPNKRTEENSVSSAKKSFRITEENKKRIDLLEQELKPKNANEMFEKLLDALIEVKRLDGAVYQQDYRVEIVELLTRVVELFDQIEKRNHSKNTTIMSRCQDEILTLNEQITSLENELNEITEKYKKDFTELNDKHVLEVSGLKLTNKNLEDTVNQKELELKKVTESLEKVKANLKSTEDKLSVKTSELAEITSSNKEKDRVLMDLSDKNRELAEQSLEQIKKINKLELKNGELEAKVEGLNDKLETTLTFQKQQNDLYEQQLNTYKELLANKK